MKAIELKNSFHDLIDSIDNEALLLNFYHLIKNRYSAKEGELWELLTYKEQEELLFLAEEADLGKNSISHDKMKTKHKKWL
ncbi:MAG: hypothetical protein HN778_14720 [Prolixibacteraceae bacterium]|jgi:hypothetical protein|nr:hypothetical protein [Prolixibacteraceae bacterium]MBT6005537.1 hypothetical protein [Prolixibacteraceae bacterium]MBT6764203.1 hypothetical protein [Prolixibacteraceae bacterium]MBT6999128.1 hypothetical protein [Prolixibacteraceae bacterium]MBT7396082.1 hypothetical protein [Prolixibacteraceae bacterium]